MTKKADSESTFSPSLLETTPAVLSGMQPAFRHQRPGEYGFAGLPDEWIVERDTQGNPIALHPDVVAGYWRDARFIALGQLAQMPLDA